MWPQMPVAHVPAQHILFIDNECRAGGGITIGSEGSGGVHNVSFENIFYNSSASESGAKRRGPSGPDMKTQPRVLNTRGVSFFFK